MTHSPLRKRRDMTTDTRMPSIRLLIKRVYEPPSDADGFRVLVDRLWPRGLSKATVAVDLWLRDVAPSSELRKWFNHDPARWTEFRRRYAAELDCAPAGVDLLLAWARKGPLTLLYGAQNETSNNAVALSLYLSSRLRPRSSKETG